jgi:hypothetical protein
MRFGVLHEAVLAAGESELADAGGLTAGDVGRRRVVRRFQEAVVAHHDTKSLAVDAWERRNAQ